MKFKRIDSNMCVDLSVCICLSVYLRVRSVPPNITQLRNVTAVEGSAAMVSCTAEGEPVPEISWRRASDGQTFKDGDKVKSAHTPLTLHITMAEV